MPGGKGSGEGAQHHSASPAELGNEMEQPALPRQVSQERNTNGFLSFTHYHMQILKSERCISANTGPRKLTLHLKATSQ